jgi:hypothetical protein
MSWAANALYSPVPKLDLGVEYRQPEREFENGTDGSMSRLQATAQYSFQEAGMETGTADFNTSRR